MSDAAARGGPVLTMPRAPLAFHLMAKPTGAVCNLDCEYCFFLSKEMLYPGSRFRMAADLQETYLRQLLEAHARAPEVVVAWQGGEPTMMGLDFFRRAIDLERRYARPGQRIQAEGDRAGRTRRVVAQGARPSRSGNNVRPDHADGQGSRSTSGPASVRTRRVCAGQNPVDSPRASSVAGS